jgi:hypothetical protein
VLAKSILESQSVEERMFCPRRTGRQCPQINAPAQEVRNAYTYKSTLISRNYRSSALPRSGAPGDTQNRISHYGQRANSSRPRPVEPNLVPPTGLDEWRGRRIALRHHRISILRNQLNESEHPLKVATLANAKHTPSS